MSFWQYFVHSSSFKVVVSLQEKLFWRCSSQMDSPICRDKKNFNFQHFPCYPRNNKVSGILLESPVIVLSKYFYFLSKLFSEHLPSHYSFIHPRNYLEAPGSHCSSLAFILWYQRLKLGLQSLEEINSLIKKNAL